MDDLGRVGRNLVRTFYDPLPSCTSDDPIWCLGRRYDPLRRSARRKSSSATPTATTPSTTSALDTSNDIASPPARSNPTTEDDSWIRTSTDEGDRKESPNGADPRQYGDWPCAFLDDFESRIWMTYRSGFPPIKKSLDPRAAAAMSFRVRMQTLAQNAFTTDTGFGCMIRSAQCILANALLELRLGRDWRITDSTPSTDDRAIISLFADDPRAPFSIHRFVAHGAAVCGKYPGEWFGPSAAARCIQDLVHEYKDAGLRVYISGDNTDVYDDDVKKVALDAEGKFQPTLILVGTRLGIDKITQVYWEALKASLQLRQSVGIAGGRPSASHYFIGTQGTLFFYLDPHTTRPALPYHATPLCYSQEDVLSCHTRRLRALDIRDMDPSMLIAFLVKDEADYEDWKEKVVAVQGKSIVRVMGGGAAGEGRGKERAEAVDEVESWDERSEGEDEEGEVVVEKEEERAGL
ncbi:autophagy-related protein-like protein 4 [Westerdykella ornata]|uniref:Cysteine protease n=1 Tax=Westerdykella ornata TaxID=318751 RepID=A0A6A6JPR9_WESOR|nr:autophagy-related protein-like protein 4 [Westerdykella ornata]KAF2278377.1 autophagy-related protein-like protein 4 [Westerdykella ornata]